jgi:hypothetical protein
MLQRMKAPTQGSDAGPTRIASGVNLIAGSKYLPAGRRGARTRAKFSSLLQAQSNGVYT